MWVFYPWLKNNSNLDLIHPDYQEVENIGIGLCVDSEKEYITLKTKNGLLKVKKEGVKNTLPSPKFIWHDEVCELIKPDLKLVIFDFFWHHNRQKYFYYVFLGEKKRSKYYSEDELNFFCKMIIHYENFFDEIGTFGTYMGKNVEFKDNLLVPLFNLQIGTHPLNNLNTTIQHLKIGYLYFINVKPKCDILDNTYSTFFIETTDYKTGVSIWDWNIIAKKQLLIVPKDFDLQVEPWTVKALDTDCLNLMFDDISLQNVIKAFSL